MMSQEALGLYKHFLFALGVVELTQIEAVPTCSLFVINKRIARKTLKNKRFHVVSVKTSVQTSSRRNGLVNNL
jgi:hypothetical protein